MVSMAVQFFQCRISEVSALCIANNVNKCSGDNAEPMSRFSQRSCQLLSQSVQATTEGYSRVSADTVKIERVLDLEVMVKIYAHADDALFNTVRSDKVYCAAATLSRNARARPANEEPERGAAKINAIVWRSLWCLKKPSGSRVE